MISRKLLLKVLARTPETLPPEMTGREARRLRLLLAARGFCERDTIEREPCRHLLLFSVCDTTRRWLLLHVPTTVCCMDF